MSLLLGGTRLQLWQLLGSSSQCTASQPLLAAARLHASSTHPAAVGSQCASKKLGTQLHRQLAGGAVLPQRQRQSQRGQLHIVAGGGGGGLGGGTGGGRKVDTVGQRLLLSAAVGYMLLIVIIPFFNVFVQAFSHGLDPFIETVQEPDFQQAVKMTMLLSLVAVPTNTLFGVQAALALARNKDFPGRTFLISLLDLPFSISPVITGMMFVLLYGRKGLFAPLIAKWGFPIVFAFPGMALATLFVTMPFVVRELLPILEQMDLAEEEAARSLGANNFQVFWNVTLPNIRWGLLYGIILTNARAMGEFGAVSVISGNIIGQTQTLTLYVESAYKEYNTEAAFAAAVLLSFLALFTLLVKDRLESQAAEETSK